MAIYTVQLHSESGSFAPPQTDEIHWASNLAYLDWLLDNWESEHNRVGSDSADASLMVWRGRLMDVQDRYPDFVCRRGKRGGLVREAC